MVRKGSLRVPYVGQDPFPIREEVTPTRAEMLGGEDRT
jgi:hypothetical protein